LPTAVRTHAAPEAYTHFRCNAHAMLGLLSRNLAFFKGIFAPTALRGRPCRPCGSAYRASRAGRPTRYSALGGRLPAAPRCARATGLPRRAHYVRAASLGSLPLQTGCPTAGRGRGTIVPPNNGSALGRLTPDGVSRSRLPQGAQSGVGAGLRLRPNGLRRPSGADRLCRRSAGPRRPLRSHAS
jgi:hypothetical protein